MSSEHDRRTFIAAALSVTGLVAADGAAPLVAAQAPAGATPQWDISWFDTFKGRHKQVHDYGSYDLSGQGQPFRYMRNYLDSMRDVFQLTGSDVNTAIGISRPAFAVNASDALWDKYKLGEKYKITDPMTRQPALRNIFMDTPNYGVKSLQASGTVFWQCNVALGAVIGELARAAGKQAADIRAEIVAGLNPGVRIVPSHVFALGMVQERGFTYMKALPD
ncbi:MAG TPA: hypothetical protein VHZ73_03475 [Vicinamibacterales bacterium]|jgi:hypothetical protein|nr:hypothetical protein [Vicinamibacterales bacterium]